VSASALLHAAMLRWLNELSSQGVFTTDVHLTVASWNAWLERATGVAAADVVGRPLLEAFPELAGRRLDRYYRAALNGEASVLSHGFHSHLIRVATPSGHMLQTARVAPLLEGDAIIGTITAIDDVSERVHSETQLRGRIAEAEHARGAAEDALRVKDEFLATLSHELRTPLNAVLGWTRILLGQNVDQEMMTRALHVIDRNAAAQARLIDDMLDMARIVTGKLRLEFAPVDLMAATLAAIDVVAPTAQAKNITIHKMLGNRPLLINADGDRIQQIVWNVLSNAVKFTPQGGRIDLRLGETAEHAQLMITDTGKGISAEFLPHVFERFRQANSSVSRTEGGLGLGLALVQQLVALHGGDIAVSSAGPGHGATFTVTFPLAAADDTQLTLAIGAPSRTLSGRRVMVVDDEEDWCDALAQMLKNHGAEVQVAHTADQALAMISSGDWPHALIADIGLPGTDGFELVRRVRELESGDGRIPAIAVTAYSGKANIRRALEAGFDQYRVKPISSEDVVAAVAGELTARDPREPGKAAGAISQGEL